GAWRDLAYTLRLARKQPLYAGIVVGSLAMGVGLSTAVFSFFNALVLQPLPGVRSPERLAYLVSRGPTSSWQLPISYLNYRDLRERNHLFSDLAAYQSIRVGMATGNGEPEQLSGEIVTNNFFRLLGSGSTPATGFAAEPESRSLSFQPEVVIGDGLWQRRF